ncbi:MAG: PAS domain S-box protein, partial [Gallionellaceae bacterium]|nr:PAS domain S-box protein [Gallionellaceae bacterium]
LLENEERLRLALSAANQGWFDVELKTGAVTVSPEYARMLGYEPDDFRTDLPNWLDHVHPDDRESVYKAFQACMKDGGPHSMEYRRRTRSGEWKWIQSIGKITQWDTGHQATRMVGIHADITERKQMEEALRDSEAHLRSILRATPIGIGVVVNRVFTEINDGIQHMTGYSREELLGNSSRILYPSDSEFDRVGKEKYGQILDQGIGTLETRWQCKNGAIRDIYLSSAPIHTDDLDLGVIFTAEDITVRKQAEAELEQYHHHLEELVAQRTAELMQTEARASHILQSSADGLYGVDAQGIITFINPAACALLGYQAEQVIGQSAHALFHHSKPDGSPFPKEECPSHSGLLLGREVRIDDEVYWHADGHPIPVMYAMHPLLLDGKVTGAVISVIDISEQRAAAQAREQALIAAEDLARLRSEFLANMSHEIRTPINGVLGFAEIGARNYQDSEKARYAFQQILGSGKRLLGVINDILDFSKIEAGKLNVEMTEVSLAEVIRQAIELARERVQAKHLKLLAKLAPDMPMTFLGDPLRIGQVLTNLVSNAVKFTEAGSITLSASRQGDALVFKVMDTGIGMNAEQQAQLFQPFQQADGSITRKYGGTGLGLAISRRILELMGGEIRVESQPGLGSTFEFRLPYVEATVRTGAAIPDRLVSATGKPLTGLSILVAEDDRVNQEMLETILVDAGARIVMVGNGREAVERVMKDGGGAYDIVLMDVQMPKMDGYEATRQISVLAPSLPIIGQTAYAMTEEKARCLEAGMVDHIAKPIDSRTLVQLVLQHAASGQPR